MADRLKLAAGLRNLPASAREDLAGREQDIQRGKTVELLRRAGKEMYDNPIVNTAIGLSPVLGDIQAGVEAYRSAEAGDWGNAGLNAAGMLPFIPMLGKTVWHGSPHKFDAFDISKIGSGEGSQAFGHGLYLAEAPETAKQYQAMANNPAKRQGGLTGEGRDQAILDSLIKLNAKKYTEGDVNKLAELVAQRPAAFTNPEKMIERIGQYEGNAAPSYLYKVDLPDEQIAKMLDWDKPLSEQAPEVLEAIKQSSAKYGATRNYAPIYSEEAAPYMRGQDFYRDLSNALSEGGVRRGSTALSGQDALASQHLNELGIPGIQYLDQASRGAGEGTRNYVVFSDEIPQILERNNQPVGMFK